MQLGAASLCYCAATLHAQYINTGTNHLPLFDSANWSGGMVNGLFIGSADSVEPSLVGTGSDSVPIIDLSGATYAAGSNLVYTGAYNATQLSVGTLITGGGFAAGTYVTAINNAGQITVSTAASAASDGSLSALGLGYLNGPGTKHGGRHAGSYNASTGVVTLDDNFDLATVGAKAGQNIRGVYSGTQVISTNILDITSGSTFRIVANADDRAVDFEFTVTPWNMNVSGSGTIAGDFVYRNKDPWIVQFAIDSGKTGYIKFQAAPGKDTATILIDTDRTINTSDAFRWGDTGRILVTDFDGQRAVLDIAPRANSPIDVLRFYATGTNLSALTKTGGGIVRLDGNNAQNIILNDGADADVRIEKGVLYLATNNQNMTAARIQNASRYDLIGSRSSLYLDLSNVNASQTQLNLIDNAPVNLHAGALLFKGNGASVLSGQELGAVSLHEGRSALGFVNGSVNNFTLTLDALTRKSANATVNFVGLASAGAGRVLIASGSDSNILGDLVGTSEDSETNAGRTNLKILPWATARTMLDAGDYGYNLAVNANAYASTNLVTYSSGGGFRVLTNGEYQTDINTTATDENVRVDTHGALTADRTYNSLSIGSSTLGLNGNTLTVTSGVVQASGALVIGSAPNDGQLNTGDRALIINGDGNYLTFNSSITNSVTGSNASVIVNNSNRTYFDGANNYTGATVVQGQLWIRNNSALPSASAVLVDSGGVLLIDSASDVHAASLGGLGQVVFNNSNKKLSIGGGGFLTASDNGITVFEGGIITPGDPSGPLQVGTFTVGTNVPSLIFSDNSILAIDLASDTLYDSIAVGVENTLAPHLYFEDEAIIRLNFLNDYTPDDGTQWLLTTGFGTSGGDLGKVLLQDASGNALGDDYLLDFVNHNLMLTYNIPEPATWALFLTGGATLLFTIRRRRR
jgi:hypothetical protein